MGISHEKNCVSHSKNGILSSSVFFPAASKSRLFIRHQTISSVQVVP